MTRQLFRRRRYICPGVYFAPRPNSFSFRAKVKQSKGVAGWQPTSRFLVVRTMRSDGALQPIAHAESFQCLVYGAKSWPTYLSLMPQRYPTYENAKLVSSYDNYPSSWSRGKSTILARRSSRRLSRNHVPATQMFHVTSRAFWNTPAIRSRWRGWVSIYRAGKWRRKSRIVGCWCWWVRFSYSGRKHKENVHFTCIVYILLCLRTKYLLLNKSLTRLIHQNR